VFNSSETVAGGVYSAAELFAGPNKFGSYYAGVLPNGRKVIPAGNTIQIGMNPLGVAVTPDGKFLITTNDDERESGFASYQSPGVNLGGYSISVVDTTAMAVVSQTNVSGKFFVGLQVTGTGPYTVFASGGGDNDVKLFTVSATGQIAAGTPAHIVILPWSNTGTDSLVSHYLPGTPMNTADGSGNKPPVPTGFSRTGSTMITFPAGSALSPDGKFLYVACNGDNSVAVINTATSRVVKQISVGYFPYSVSVSTDGTRVTVSNWGITNYAFKNATFDQSGFLNALGTTGQNYPDGFYIPVTSTTGANPRTSSLTVLYAPGGDGSLLANLNSKWLGHKLDALKSVGDTHPSATAIVRGSTDVLFIAKSNSDALAMISLATKTGTKLPDFNLAPITVTGAAPAVHGAYPNALAVSPDNTRLYVAEAGINSVAVLDVTNPTAPALLGRIPTGWYPTAVTVSPDGHYLYITNAKGVGEDINPSIDTSTGTPAPSGLQSDPTTDSNYIFGSLQQVDLTSLTLDNTTVLGNNYAVNSGTIDTTVVPIGGKASPRIKHVIFILHENKTFDSMLGDLSTQFGNFAGTTFNNTDGSAYTNGQFTGVSLNLQALAGKFATAVNYYSDSEESDAGHQFAASGTASDYTEKTLLVKSGRGLLVNKNFEPEDYPEAGYIFNNAARHNVSFKDYGALVRVVGTDTGTSTPTTLNDPNSGNAGLPQLQADNFTRTNPLVNLGDTTTPVSGLGQSYFMSMPILSILGTNNASGEPRLDVNYPGYNFNISDQRRAQEFMNDFDRMILNGTLPTYIYLYQPNDHTGSIQAPNANLFTNTPLEEVADADVALGMVIQHIMTSPIYYEYTSNIGTAIFVTFDDAQSSLDHIHPHRTPLLVISPFAKPGYIATRHYSTASIVKTEELLLGLPAGNLGDLLATDLRDMFQSKYNGITSGKVQFAPMVKYLPTVEGKRIWTLASALNTMAPDRDSHRLGALIRLSAQADELHNNAEKENRLSSAEYKKEQEKLYEAATKVVSTGAPRDDDDD
jgi:YVTN family beta-propeller protein